MNNRRETGNRNKAADHGVMVLSMVEKSISTDGNDGVDRASEWDESGRPVDAAGGIVTGSREFSQRTGTAPGRCGNPQTGMSALRSKASCPGTE